MKKKCLIFALAMCMVLGSACGKKETKEAEKEAVHDITINTEEPEKEEKPDEIQEKIDAMSLEEKVGQMFIARCPEAEAVDKVSQYHLGGYILFGRDFKDRKKEVVTEAIEAYQNASKIPMFIGVDEEGGIVNRISTNTAFRSEPFASPQELFSKGGLEAVKSDTIEKSELLRSIGINLNFAPVCDVPDGSGDFIYERSFGTDAKKTSEYVKTVVETMKEQKMGSVLKHFPGYGNNVDTHTGTAMDERDYDTFVNEDFLPFEAGIEAGADVVLVSHNIVKSMDADYPASLSPKVHEILREELGFEGVIITDDLVMEGVREFADDSQVAVLAVKAGNDLLCCTDFETQIPAVIDAVKNGEISEERIEESVYRILKMKESIIG